MTTDLPGTQKNQYSLPNIFEQKAHPDPSRESLPFPFIQGRKSTNSQHRLALRKPYNVQALNGLKPLVLSDKPYQQHSLSSTGLARSDSQILNIMNPAHNQKITINLIEKSLEPLEGGNRMRTHLQHQAEFRSVLGHRSLQHSMISSEHNHVKSHQALHERLMLDRDSGHNRSTGPARPYESSKFKQSKMPKYYDKFYENFKENKNKIVSILSHPNHRKPRVLSESGQNQNTSLISHSSNGSLAPINNNQPSDNQHATNNRQNNQIAKLAAESIKKIQQL